MAEFDENQESSRVAPFKVEREVGPGRPLEFDLEPVLMAQLDTAYQLAALIDRSKLSPGAFAKVAEAATGGIKSHDDQSFTTQEQLARDANEKFVVTMALVLTDGDAEKAQQLLGQKAGVPQVTGYDDGQFNLAGEIKRRMNRVNNTQVSTDPK